MLNCQAVKSPIFSAIVFATILILIFAGSHLSNLSVYPEDIISSIVYEAPQTTVGDYQARRTPKLDSCPLLTMQSTNEEEEDGDAPDPLNPPSNFTRQERREWFRIKSPELAILKSNDLGQKFHGRVMEFFNNQCTNQFFMIWFSPARTFGPREFLAVETLFKANTQACLIILSRYLDTKRGNEILKPLLDRGYRILAITPDLPFLVKNTPAEAWLDEIKSGKRYPGAVSFTIHLSDLIRLAVLYKYGGVYLDTDFIVINNFKGLRNAVGVQTMDQKTQQWSAVNNALLIFDIAHPILFQFLKEFATTFNGDKWGHNGPDMLSRVIRRLDKEGIPGYNITIFPPKAFYPVDWIHIPKFYRKPRNDKESKWVEDTVVELNRESYGLHLWNKITRGIVIQEGSVIDRLIAFHCLICRDTYKGK